MNPRTVLLASALLILLGVSNVAFAARQPLMLTMTGAIVSAGSQQYSHRGGDVVNASILGQQVDPSKTKIQYWLSASVNGISAAGSASFDMKTVGRHSASIRVQGSASITGMIPAEEFPLGCTFGINCTSAIPGLYTGRASVSISQGGSTVSMVLPMMFESAFLNPFGGPIFMASPAGEVFIAATYSQAKVVWTGTQLGGNLSGTFGSASVKGLFGMNVNAVEDLKAGSEDEQGTIAFAAMSNPALDAVGPFNGNSVIPPGSPCPSQYGFPTGTCTLTGFFSSGTFHQVTAQGERITGMYITSWIVPAVAFGSVVKAFLK